jgi:peptidoglycan/LPS O-acetylase OafA/YrhL
MHRITLPKKTNPSWLDRWHVHASMNSDYDVIDGLRGIAILLVVACHLFSFSSNSSDLIRLIGGTISAGKCGVTLFFCLSGFLISLPFWKRKMRSTSPITPPGYVGRRLWKIYPPLALSILICAPIDMISLGPKPILSTALFWLTGMPLLFPVSSALNGVMWTLIVEIHFYATLPLLFLLTNKTSYRTTMIILFSALLIIPTAYKWWLLRQGLGPTLTPMIDTQYPVLLSGFAGGVLIASLECLTKIGKHLARFSLFGFTLIALSMVAISLLDLYPPAPHSSAILSEIIYFIQLLAAGLLLLLIADPTGLVSKLISTPFLRWFGIISYEWYLLHQPIHHLYCHYFGSADGNFGRWLTMLITTSTVSLLLAAAIYLGFSKPILQWGRNRNRIQKSIP